MATVAEASLTPAERPALDRFVGPLKEELGPALHGVWLYGSRARGEPAGALYSPKRLDQRREIRSFFIQEVDRDKIVLHGEP